MQRDLTKGNVMSSMLLFAGPMIAGNLLQQLYNVADTLIVGRYLGSDALAAVGSSFTLMVFLTSILLGLSMGSGAFFLHALRRQTGGGFKKKHCPLLYSHRRHCFDHQCRGDSLHRSSACSIANPR